MEATRVHLPNHWVIGILVLVIVVTGLNKVYEYWAHGPLGLEHHFVQVYFDVAEHEYCGDSAAPLSRL